MSEFTKSKEVTDFNVMEEDTVQIKMFSLSSNSDLNFWENLCQEINLTLKTISQNYIWHKEEFKVCLPILDIKIDDATPMHLTSSVCFGDNIEDEWYIVYLIMEISKLYKSLVVQIVDGDGDFLLIEAANYLPVWANPESTINRVFIINNAVHIIPPHLVGINDNIQLKGALEILKHNLEKTQASLKIQEAIQSRLGQYPKKIEDNYHKAIVKIPLDVATLLTLQPSLIAPLVTTYCNHDIIDAKNCRNLNYTEHIPVKVKFTKCLYAMLIHSKLMVHLKRNVSSENDKREILGLKLTSGFQMIMAESSKNIYRTKEYLNFEKNLKDNGYFKDNIESSLEYNQLLDKARQYFLDIECPTNSCVSKMFTDLMATENFMKIKEKLKYQNINEELSEDDDDWLNIDPTQLNDLLNNRYGNDIKFDKNDVIAPETITTKLTDFLKKSSDFEGVDTKNCHGNESDSIDFHAERFESCLEKIMNFLSSDVNDINLDDGDSSESECESDLADDIDNDRQLEEELSKSANLFEQNRSNSKTVTFNLAQSIKEEGLSGPSSNLLTNVGINKTDLLDSDDD